MRSLLPLRSTKPIAWSSALSAWLAVVLITAACSSASSSARPPGASPPPKDGGAQSPDGGSEIPDAAAGAHDSATVQPTPAEDSSTACTATSAVCPKGCANLATDVNNCGSCELVCPAGAGGATAVCQAGQCSMVCSSAGTTLCMGADQGGPYCADLQTDVANCGSCGQACEASGATATCSAGQCGGACPGGQTFCSGQCVDTTSDLDNCGGCGASCSAKAQAMGLPGTATLACTAGACSATVSGYAGINCANGCTQTCDQLCNSQLHVPCDPNNPPDNCTGETTGACGSYYELFGTGAVSCDVGFACSQPIDGSAMCGTAVYIPLAGINCQCAGTVSLP